MNENDIIALARDIFLRRAAAKIRGDQFTPTHEVHSAFAQAEAFAEVANARKPDSEPKRQKRTA